VVEHPGGVRFPVQNVARDSDFKLGKAWVTWTDEEREIRIPALPAGHYRIEIRNSVLHQQRKK